MRRPRFARLTVAALFFALAAAPSFWAAAQEAEFADPFRRGTNIPSSPIPPRMAPPVDDDRRQVRNYPEQPPVIPHDIRGYAVTRDANKCMACHSRRRAPEAGAPMVSVSHFMNRDFIVLTQISPRRYFCTQCHAPQVDAPPLVENGFVDGEDLPPE